MHGRAVNTQANGRTRSRHANHQRKPHYLQTPPHSVTIGADAHPLFLTQYVGQETILLVDDNPIFRELLSLALRAYGYHVIDAAGGEDALAQAARHAAPIHLVVTDVVMPDLDGRELVGDLRRWYPHLRVIFMSGHPERAGSVQASEDERTVFMLKPFPMNRLVAAVRGLLDACPN
jgi:DNA-binding NtrC family response regulator